MKLKAAILIIGSLLWDPDQGNAVGYRKIWRNDRLAMKDKIHVKAPIRYGRLSGEKGSQNYTMVFSSECEQTNKFGTAFVVPLKTNEIRSIKGIENQARFLSKAERNSNDKLCKGNQDKWCTIGILFHPLFDKKLKLKFLARWHELLEKENGLKDYQDYKIGSEESILSEFGEIKINWPKAIDKRGQKLIDKLDIILATCTKPNIDVYPDIEELRKKVQNDDRKYFFQNIESGITTFQDRKLLQE